MKHRYIVTTYVDAKNPIEALKLAKTAQPLAVTLDYDMWKDEGFALKESDKPKIGFKKRNEKN